MLDKIKVAELKRLEQKHYINLARLEKINLQFKYAYLDMGRAIHTVRRYHHAIRVSQYIKPSPKRNPPFVRKGESANPERSKIESMRRAKSNIISLTLGNQWTWWCTFTFSEQHQNIEDAYAEFRKVYNSLLKMGIKFAYLIVPERHDKGGYHFHALIQGADNLFQRQVKQTGLYKGQYYKDKKGRDVYDFLPMMHSGFTNCVKIDNNPDSFMATALYIGNYVSKQKADEFHKHRYYASRGLSKGTTILTMAIHPDELKREIDGVQFKVKAIPSATTGEMQVYARSHIFAIDTTKPIDLLSTGLAALMFPRDAERLPFEYGQDIKAYTKRANDITQYID
jgi:hypothetical protein